MTAGGYDTQMRPATQDGRLWKAACEAAEARATAAESEVARLTAEVARVEAERDDLRHQCCALRAKRGKIGPELWGKHPSRKRWEQIDDGSNTDERVAEFEECYRAAGWTNLQRWSPFSKTLDAASASALRDRVAVLEKALRFYADDENYRIDGACNPEHAYFTGPNTARAALNESRDA